MTWPEEKLGRKGKPALPFGFTLTPSLMVWSCPYIVVRPDGQSQSNSMCHCQSQSVPVFAFWLLLWAGPAQLAQEKQIYWLKEDKLVTEPKWEWEGCVAGSRWELAVPFCGSAAMPVPLSAHEGGVKRPLETSCCTWENSATAASKWCSNPCCKGSQVLPSTNVEHSLFTF